MSRRSSVRIETSSIETGSSATISSGSMTSAPGDHDPLALAAGQLVRVAERRSRRPAGARPPRAPRATRPADRDEPPRSLTISGSVTKS